MNVLETLNIKDSTILNLKELLKNKGYRDITLWIDDIISDIKIIRR